MAEEWYEIVASEHFWSKWRFEIFKKIIPENYDWGRTLDIGCGHGIFGELIEKSYGIKISGCDLNLKALKMAPPGQFPLYFYNIRERFKEFDQSFSTILLMDVLEHIDDPCEFLDAVRFHLKANGRLIINVPAIPSLYSRYDQAAGHVKRYNFLTLKKELELAGFEIEKKMSWGMSLIPVLLIRKFILLFCTKDKIIETGFKPSHTGIKNFLNFLRQAECAISPGVIFGASIMVIAKKKT